MHALPGVCRGVPFSLVGVLWLFRCRERFLSGKLRLHREAERSSVRKYRGSDLSNNRISTNEISLFEVY